MRRRARSGRGGSFRALPCEQSTMMVFASLANLPVERSIKFSLTVNVKTAKALGLAVPQAVLLVADEAVEYGGAQFSARAVRRAIATDVGD